MVVAKMYKEKVILPTHISILQTGYSDCKRRTGVSICTTSDTLLQYNKEKITKNDLLSDLAEDITSWGNKGEKIILMGDIYEYILS